MFLRNSIIIHYTNILFYPKNSTPNSRKNLNHFGIKTVTNSLKTINNLINDKNNNNHVESRAGDYELPCRDCNKKYVGETCRRLKRIYTHKRDLKRAIMNNGFVKHNLETNHNFNSLNTRMLVYLHKKKTSGNCWI